MQPLCKTVWKFLKKLKIELLYDPAVPLPCIYPKSMKTQILKDVCTSAYCSIIYNNEHMKTT